MVIFYIILNIKYNIRIIWVGRREVFLPQRKKKEKYIHRWLREHPQIRLYLKKEEYEYLKKIADSKGVSMKEVVLETIRKAREYYDDRYKEGLKLGLKYGFDSALDMFIENPGEFAVKVMERAKSKGIEDFKPILIVYPCRVCRKRLIMVTHKDKAIIESMINRLPSWVCSECRRKKAA